jgi:hypothetical protein
MKRATFSKLIFMTASILLGGCGRSGHPPDKDVTSLPEYNFSPFAGNLWKTKVKVVLADLKRYNGWTETYILAPCNFDSTHPKYRPPSDLQQIVAELPIGTRLQIKQLKKDCGIAGFRMVTASLEDGKEVILSDYFLARNRFIRNGPFDSKEWGVDPDLLEKAD